MAKPIKSPCTSVCQLAGDVCLGCGRTRAEIATWKSMKHPEKKAAARKAALRLKKLDKASS